MRAAQPGAAGAAVHEAAVHAVARPEGPAGQTSGRNPALDG